MCMCILAAMASTAGSSRGERVKAWREETRMTQQELADKLGLDQSLVSRMESGRYTPNLDAAIRLAKASRGRLPVDMWLEPTRKTA